MPFEKPFCDLWKAFERLRGSWGIQGVLGLQTWFFTGLLKSLPKTFWMLFAGL